MTTPTLSERLRAGSNFYAESSQWSDQDLADAVDEAADALDTRDSELDRLRDECARLRGLIRRALPMADALDATRTAVVWTGDLQVDATILAKEMRAAMKGQP